MDERGSHAGPIAVTPAFASRVLVGSRVDLVTNGKVFPHRVTEVSLQPPWIRIEPGPYKQAPIVMLGASE